MVIHLENPFVSIVLPTYNRQVILRECLISVIGQSYKNWEIIVVDDCSSMPIEAGIKDLMEKDDRIKYCRNVFRRMLPASRNIGISIAKYDIILFLEDDMVLDPDALRILVDAYQSQQRKDPMFGAIAPSIPFVQYNELKNLDAIKDRLLKERPSLNDRPFTASKLTGAMITDFNPKYQAVQEVPGAHACIMYPKKLLISEKGFKENVYKGNNLREESDMSFRLKKRGYRFYFEPMAIFFHVRVTEGGCRMNTPAYIYYTIVNHTKFLYYNYGLIKTLYMAPMFMLRTFKVYAIQVPKFLSRRLASHPA